MTTTAFEHHPLVIAMQVAVPLYVAQLHTVPATTRDRLIREWADTGAHVIAETGDVLQYGAGMKAPKKERARVGDAINATARGIAAATFAPGGIHVFGLIWCALHSPGGRRSDAAVCEACGREAAA